jgi:hypothetical protein
MKAFSRDGTTWQVCTKPHHRQDRIRVAHISATEETATGLQQPDLRPWIYLRRSKVSGVHRARTS